MPPHVFLLAAVGASLMAGYRLAHWSLNQKKKSEAARRAADPREPEARNLGNLVADPDTGEYRPQA